MTAPAPEPVGQFVNFSVPKEKRGKSGSLLDLLGFLPYQRDILHCPKRFVFVNKARQIRISFTMAVWAIMKAMQGENVVYISRTEDHGAAWMADYVARIVHLLESERAAEEGTSIVPMARMLNLSAKFTAEFGGATIKCMTSSPKSAQGFTAHVILDEFAHHDDQEALYASLIPMTTQGYDLRIITTPNTVQDYAWQVKLKAEDDPAWGVFNIDIHQAIEEGIIGKDGEPLDVYEILSSQNELQHHIETGQYGPVFSRNYLGIPSGADLCVFGLDAMKLRDDLATPPVARFTMHRGVFTELPEDAHDSEAGCLRMWQAPEEGHRYVLSADPSLGSKGADETALAVMDVATTDVVATLTGYIGTVECGKWLIAIGTLYNWAFLIPEANGAGQAVIDAVKAPVGEDEAYTAYPLELLYTARDFSSGKSKKRWGFWADRTSRAMWVQRLVNWFNKQEGALPDKDSVEQGSWFVSKGERAEARDKGKSKARTKTALDDRMATLGICLIGVDACREMDPWEMLEVPNARAWREYVLDPARRRHTEPPVAKDFSDAPEGWDGRLEKLYSAACVIHMAKYGGVFSREDWFAHEFAVPSDDDERPRGIREIPAEWFAPREESI